MRQYICRYIFRFTNYLQEIFILSYRFGRIILRYPDYVRKLHHYQIRSGYIYADREPWAQTTHPIRLPVNVRILRWDPVINIISVWWQRCPFGAALLLVLKVTYFTAGSASHLPPVWLLNMTPGQIFVTGNVISYAIGRKPCHQQPRICPRSADKY